MTNEAHQQGEAPPGLISQMLALLRLLIETFAQAWTEERAKLRALRACPVPDNWQAHWPPLREVEIKIHGLTLSGIEQLRTKGAVDLLKLTCIEDPTFAPTEPATFEDMRGRYEAVAAFMADPIPFIRHAAELAAAPTVLRFAQSTSPSPADWRRKTTGACSTSRFPPPCEARGRWIATSSSRDGGGSRTHARGPPPHLVLKRPKPTSPASPARTHPRVYAATSPSKSSRRDMSARRAA